MHRSVLLIRNAAKDDFGGAETYQVSLALILKENQFNPIIVSRSKKLLSYSKKNNINTLRGWWWKRQNWNGVHLLLLPLYIVWQLILTVWYIYIIKKTTAIALHVQSRDDFIAATLAGKIMGTPVVWTDHMDLRYIFQSISLPLRNPVGKLVFFAAHLASRIILISDNEHNLVTSHFKHKGSLKKQITLINNGVLDKILDMPERNDDKSFHFCLASRIVENKGIGEAIKAFILLQSRIEKPTDVKLDIYGDGEDLNKFKKLAENNTCITFHGHQDDAIEKIYQSGAFILPSYQEGFSIALLEATMLGKAIIASNIDSNPEIIHHKKTGLLIETKSEHSLEEAMYALLNDSDLRQHHEKNARQNFIDNYDLRKIVKEKIIPLYR